MSRTIELKWNCRDCDTKGILGRYKQCPSCGSPREKGEMQMSGLSRADYGADGRNKAATVNEKELAALAKAGPDWFCSHCTSGNKGNGTICSNCSAPRYSTRGEDHPDFAGDHTKRQRLPDFSGLTERVTPRPSASPPPPPRKPPAFPVYDELAPEPALDKGLYLKIGAGLGAFVLTACAVGWAFTTHDIEGSVTAMTWSHTVTVQRWTQTTARLWQHQTREASEVPPINGTGERAGLDLVEGSCRSEHFDDERYVCGSHQECHDVNRTESESYSCSRSETYTCGETCSDNGNGFATCTDQTCTRDVPDTCTRSVSVFDHKDCHDEDDYCTRPIMKDRCDYHTQTWTTISAPALSGYGKETSWPAPTLGSLDRSSRSSEYTVTLSYMDEGKTETDTRTPPSLSDYMTWDVGENVTFHINNLGGVSGMDRHPLNQRSTQ